MSNKEKFEFRKTVTKKYQQIEYEETYVWTWQEKVNLSKKNLNLLVKKPNGNKEKNSKFHL